MSFALALVEGVLQVDKGRQIVPGDAEKLLFQDISVVLDQMASRILVVLACGNSTTPASKLAEQTAYDVFSLLDLKT
jgi:hypothetical protein